MITLNNFVFVAKFAVELLAAELLFLTNVKRRKFYALRGALFLMAYLCVPSILQRAVASLHGSAVQAFASILRYLAICACSALGIRLCYDCRAYRICLAAIGGYTVQHAAYSLHLLLSIALHSAFGLDMYSSAAQLIMTFQVYLPSYFFLYRVFIRRINAVADDLRTWSLLLLSAGVLMNVLIFTEVMRNIPLAQSVLLRLLSIFNCVIQLSMMSNLLENLKLRRDMEFIDELSKMKENYYEALKDYIDLTNMKCHDFKHQILELRRGERTASGGALDELEDVIDIYDAICKTGNEALDVVLTEKSLICERKGIRFTYMVDGDGLLVMQKRDIHALFGNLLENAIDAVRELPQERRIIHLNVARSGPFLNIHSYNYYDAILEFEDGLPRTTKGSACDHGYGLKSIRRIAESYQGRMLISTDNSIFTLDIALPIQSE